MPIDLKKQTITMDSTLKELLEFAIEQKQKKAVVSFDAGGGRTIGFACFTNDFHGYMNIVEAYEQGRDMFANQTANAVAASIAEHGLPDPKNPQPFNICGG